MHTGSLQLIERFPSEMSHEETEALQSMALTFSFVKPLFFCTHGGITCCFTALSLLLVATGILNCSLDKCMLVNQALKKTHSQTTRHYQVTFTSLFPSLHGKLLDTYIFFLSQEVLIHIRSTILSIGDVPPQKGLSGWDLWRSLVQPSAHSRTNWDSRAGCLAHQALNICKGEDSTASLGSFSALHHSHGEHFLPPSCPIGNSLPTAHAVLLTWVSQKQSGSVKNHKT